MPIHTDTHAHGGPGSTITGPFDVTMTPTSMVAQPEGTPLARMTLVKRFRGDLDAESHGEMLAAMTATPGSAGYVAIEWVRGTLLGKRGTFVLQHSGSMDRGVPSLDLHVIPDSGTDELTGLRGTMTIQNEQGAHAYEFTFVLPR
ncbi:MAG TPA: DUF3224 domain-containing protein [Gemmatimonadales bacterium]|nr:DUF3224 domain-containing protein [Gemmatimonadales bacterium]